MRKRHTAPRADRLMRDINDITESVRNQKASRQSFDHQTDELLDSMVHLLKDKGLIENDILQVFADVDPNNTLDWHKHFFKKRT